MGGTPYDHHAVAERVWGHLSGFAVDLTVFELARALGYVYDMGTRQGINGQKVKTALAELEAEGRVLSYQLGWPCPGGYKTVWRAPHSRKRIRWASVTR